MMKKLAKKVCFDGIRTVNDFVNIASRYHCLVQVEKGPRVLDGKSILGIFSLLPEREIVVTAAGIDAQEFMDELAHIKN